VNKEPMLERGRKLNKEKPVRSLLEAYGDIIKQKERDDRWFEDKLKMLRQQTKDVILNEEQHAEKYLTKHQRRSEIIGAKEYVRDEAPNKLRVYSHYAKKYGIPYVSGTHKKTLEEIVRAIHEYEMKNRDKIIARRELDPLTKTFGLYII
jgi:2-oxo-4-hydroxy-4-carboxy--5-ureidoimidazoline (OHCU) decarboxylase